MGGDSSERRPDPPAVVTPTGIDVGTRVAGYGAFDLIIAGSAILISCVSLYIAIQQTRTMERTLAASSWPLLQVRSSNSDDAGKPVINIQVQNVGVGPAAVKSFYAEYGGQRTSIPARIVSNCCGQIPIRPDGHFGPGDVLTNFIANRVIRAGEDVIMIQMARVPKNDQVWQRLDTNRFKIKYHACYCSILGTCWESDLTGIDPKEVKQCPPAEKAEL